MAKSRARRKPAQRSGQQRGPRPHPAKGEVRRAVRERRLRVGAIWMVALSTLAWIPGGFSGFVIAKLLVVCVACVLGSLVAPAGRLPRRVTVALSAGALVFVVAALAGDTPVASLVGRWPRYEGVLVIGLYAAAVWLGAQTIRRGVDGTVVVARALAVAVLVLAAFSVLELGGISPLGDSSLERTGSLLGNATDQGLVAMMSFAVVGVAALDRRDRLLVAAVPAALLTVALSASRAALVLTVAAIAVVALLRLRRRLWPAVVAVAALSAAAVALPETRDRLLSGETVRGRAIQWDLTWDLVLDHPWLGVGPSRYVDAAGRYETKAWVDFTGVNTLSDSPHNVVLQVLVAGGIPLLLCALTVAGLAAWHGYRNVREHPELLGMLVAVGAYGVALLANFTIASSTCLAAFLAGALIAEPIAVGDRRRTKDPRPLPPAGRADAHGPLWLRGAAAAGFGLVAVLLVMSCVVEVRLQQGITAAREGDAATAEQRIDSARAWRPLDGDVAMLGAQALAELANRGDRTAAEPAVRLASVSLERTPKTYGSQMALAVALIRTNDLSEARAVLDETIAAYPARPQPYVQRGIARFGLRDVAGARSDLRTARRLAPDLAAPGRILSEIERRLGR